MTNAYTLIANISDPDRSTVSIHRTLADAGHAYQAAHTGDLRRVLDKDGRDVTQDACDAANGIAA